MKLNPFRGSGGRRRAPDSFIVLERELRDLRGEVAGLDPCACHAPQPHVQFLVRRPEGASAPAAPFACPLCEIDRLNGRLEVLTAPPAPRPQGEPLVPAPADTAGSAFATPRPAAAPDPRLRIVADTPAAPTESEGADVNAQTQAVSRADLLAAMGEGDTTQLPAVPEQGPVRRVLAVTADQLQPAQAHVPPKLPPAHLVKQQIVTFEPWLRPREDAPDPLAADDLKATVSATAVLTVPGWRSERVSLSKTG